MNYTLLEVVTEAAITVFDTVLIYYWTKAFSNDEFKNKNITFGICCCFFIVSFSITLINTSPIILIITTFLFSFCILFYENKKISSSFCLAFIFCVIAILSDALSGFILMIIRDETLDAIRFNSEIRIIGNIIAKLLAFIFIGSMYIKNKMKFRMPKSKAIFYLSILPITSIILIYQMGKYDYSFSNYQDGMLNLIGIIGLIAANISVFIFLKKESEYEEQKEREIFFKEQIENQREYYRALEISQEEIHRLQHDMKNSFIALSGYIKEKNLSAAKNYLETFTEKIENTQTSLNTGYLAIDALINAKINKAKENEIEIKHKIILPPNIAIDEMDLCIILGNALDNAIEAIRLVNKKEKQIILNIYIYGEELFIYVENSMQGNLVLKNGLLLSTKKDKENHGYGLENVEQILKIYDGEMHYKSENNVFRLYITVKQPNYV